MKKIYKFLKIIFLSSIGLFLSLWIVLSWNWLIPQNWDMLSINKWIEMVWILNSKLWTWSIVAWTNINLSYSWTNVTINSSNGGWWIAPYISNSWSIKIKPSTNRVINLEWIYFTASSNVTIPGFDGTINSVIVTSPYEINIDLTTWITEADFDIVVDNSGIQNTIWSWNGVWILSVWPIIWNWPAWTYTEDFESNNLWNWTEVTWLTNEANVSWQTITGWTTSNWTWPTGAAWWSYYIYTEASNPNFPDMTFAIETDNFRDVQNISFDYHMYWADMWILVVQTYYGWTWSDRYTLTWQQQTTQGDPWINTGNIDLDSFNVEKIRIFYTSWSDYTWDASIDNIVINSI